VHYDLCGPVKLVTLGGRHYFLLLVNNATRYMCVAPLAAKSDVVGAIRRIQVVVEECGLKLRAQRTDNGGEITST
jgi:hypothetical protein